MFRLIVLYFFILCFCSSSCKSQTDITKTSLPNQIKIKNQLTNINPIPEQVGEYICDIFEDSKGNIWFATLQYGVAKYDGESLIYFTEDNGLTSNSVVSIVEDDQGIIWFGTQSGLSKYDGMKFVNYTIEDDLIHHSMSNLLIDQEGILWVGTWGGISLFDGKSFRSLDLPNSDVKFEKYQSTMHWITELMQDSKGNIWIGRDGYGATKFDGKNFKHFTTENGLESNNIQSILEDKDGKIWFGSRIKERDHPDVEVREKGGNQRSCSRNITRQQRKLLDRIQ